MDQLVAIVNITMNENVQLIVSLLSFLFLSFSLAK